MMRLVRNKFLMVLRKKVFPVRFGQIDKQGRVTAGVQLNAKEGTHTFSMDNDGERKGCTTSISPARLQMDCGRDSKKESYPI